MILYDYFRSTASYRVRIALHLKALNPTVVPIHLANQEQTKCEYLQKNPQGLVPMLEDQGQIITQSLAIIEYLDEQYPTPALLPGSASERAFVRSLALLISCDMHPVNNLRVLNYLRKQFDIKEGPVQAWYHHWLKQGFDAFEQRLLTRVQPGKFCHGNEATVADLCLIPQVYNAHRFKFPMDNYPLINAINTHCLTLSAFQLASPA